jgi:hypothetical protein
MEKEKNKAGRRRVNLEFEEARELIRKEKISSIGQYRRWWKLNTPARIPKRPDRAYRNAGWVGWNDYLGSNNPFPCVRKSFRSFIDAKSFVHRLALNKKSEWFDYIRTGKKPKDIPSRPDVYYKNDWFTWSDFLGSNTPSIKRNIDAAGGGIFFIIQNKGMPNNVFQMGITLEGKATIFQHQQKQQFRIIMLCLCDIGFKWEEIVEQHGKPFWDGNRSHEYRVNNINEFILSIDGFVEPLIK